MGAGQGRGHVGGRRQPRGRLGQGGQQRRLRQGQGAGRLVEIGLRRRLHPIGAGAEEHPVQIELENLVLAEPVGQPAGQNRLLQLSLQRAVRPEEQGLGQLLGQAGGALHRPAGPGVGIEGAQHRQPVDGPVLVEAAVFRGQEGARNIGWQLGQGHAVAVTGPTDGDDLALAVDEGHAGGSVQGPQGVRVGDLRQAGQPGQLDPRGGQDREQQQGDSRGDGDPPAAPQQPAPDQVGPKACRWRLCVGEAVGHRRTLVIEAGGFRTDAAWRKSPSGRPRRSNR